MKIKKYNLSKLIYFGLRLFIIGICLICAWRFVDFNYFDPVIDKQTAKRYYVINLDRSQERLKNVTKEFEKHRIKFNRISAVDGNNITFNNHEKLETIKIGKDYQVHCNQESYKENNFDFIYSPPHGKRLLVKGELGLLCSSRMVWKQIAASDEDQIALIFEDDVKLDDNFLTVVNDIIDNLPTKWDIVYIDARHMETIYNGSWLKKSYPINDYLLKVTPFRGVWGTQAYIINKNSAIKLLNYQAQDGDLQVDELFASLIKRKKIQAYISRKKVINLADVESTISGRVNN